MTRAVPAWLSYFDVACAALAGALWYAFPRAGPWPLGLAMLPWVLRLALSGQLSRRTPFDLPLLLFLLTAILGVWSAYDRPVAWSKFWLVVGAVVLFYALANAQSLGTARPWLPAAFAAGVALYFLATHDWDAYPAKIAGLTRLGRALQALLPTLPGHRLHPNVAGGIMAMMMPFCVLVSIRSWKALKGRVQGDETASPPAAGRGARVDRGLHLAAGLGLSVITLFGLFMTTSRGAWVGLAAAALLAAMWGPSGRLAQRLPLPVAARWILLCLLGGGLVLVCAAGVVGRDWLAALLNSSFVNDTGLPRVELLRNTQTLIEDYPLVGAGLGSFMMLYSTYVLMLHVGFTVHSHNLLLDVAVEQGLPALLILVWTWGLLAGLAWRALRQSRHGATTAALMSLVVVLVHGQVDDALYGSRAVLLLFVPLAMALPEASTPLAPKLVGSRPRWLVAWGLPLAVIVLFGAALLWRKPLLSRLSSNLGAVQQSRAELGLYTWPEWPIQDALRRAVDLSRPIAEFERALALDAGNAAANRRLGQIELSLGQYGAALSHLEAAYVAQPANETTRQLLGEACLVNGDRSRGRALWSTVDNSLGQLDSRVWWYNYLGDVERAQALEQAIGGQ